MKLDNPAASAQQWANRLGGATQAYIDGVNGVTVAPGQLAAAAKPLWVQNTANAADKFARNSAAVSKEAWASAAVNKGAPRLASGANAAQSKMESAFTKLFPAIKSAVGSLPPRGTIDQNIERSRQFALKMHAYQK